MNYLNALIEGHSKQSKYRWKVGACFDNGDTCQYCEENHTKQELTMFEWIKRGMPGLLNNNCKGKCICYLQKVGKMDYSLDY